MSCPAPIKRKLVLNLLPVLHLKKTTMRAALRGIISEALQAKPGPFGKFAVEDIQPWNGNSEFLSAGFTEVELLELPDIDLVWRIARESSEYFGENISAGDVLAHILQAGVHRMIEEFKTARADDYEAIFELHADIRRLSIRNFRAEDAADAALLAEVVTADTVAAYNRLLDCTQFGVTKPHPGRAIAKREAMNEDRSGEIRAAQERVEADRVTVANRRKNLKRILAA